MNAATAPGAVGTGQIAPGAVTAGQIAPGAVGSTDDRRWRHQQHAHRQQLVDRRQPRPELGRNKRAHQSDGRPVRDERRHRRGRSPSTSAQMWLKALCSPDIPVTVGGAPVGTRALVLVSRLAARWHQSRMDRHRRFGVDGGRRRQRQGLQRRGYRPYPQTRPPSWSASLRWGRETTERASSSSARPLRRLSVDVDAGDDVVPAGGHRRRLRPGAGGAGVDGAAQVRRREEAR